MFGYFFVTCRLPKKAILVFGENMLGPWSFFDGESWTMVPCGWPGDLGPLDPQGIPNAVTQPWPDEASFAGTLLSKVGIGDPPLQTLLTTCLTPFSASRPSWHPLFLLFAALRPLFLEKRLQNSGIFMESNRALILFAWLNLELFILFHLSVA